MPKRAALYGGAESEKGLEWLGGELRVLNARF
jgi:hypothetical protein